MAELILKVTPEEVREKSNQINQQKGEMEGNMQEMLQKVSQLGEAWKTPSGENYVEKFQSVRQEIQDSLNALQKHTDNLVQAAETYDTLEQSQMQKVDSLSVENIF
ncbi:WXG100 family protein [Eubacterium limosum]|nr:WXG100 family protein [Eubacterium limosum]